MMTRKEGKSSILGIDRTGILYIFAVWGRSNFNDSKFTGIVVAH